MWLSMTGSRWSRIFKQAENIVTREIAGETILVPVRGRLADMQNIYTLNRVGNYIWEQLNGSKSLAEILDLVLNNFDVSREEAEQDILEFINHVAETGLVTEEI